MDSVVNLGSVIAVGHPFEGTVFYGDDEGLFNSAAAAAKVAEELFRDDDWLVVQIYRLPSQTKG